MKISLGILLGSTYLSRRQGFSPRELFAAGEPGGWYDPSDLSTMFQDNAGTTPVTATGQTVGLLLDKSQGLVMGPELVVNGDFSSSAGWTLSSSTISGGALNLAASGGGAERAITASNSVIYKCTIVVSSYTAGNMQIRINGGALAVFRVNAPGTYTTYVVAGSVNTKIELLAAGGLTTLSVDSFSSRELAGNHLTQATAASRPIYGIEPFGGRRNLLTYTEQFDNAAWSKLAATIAADSTTAPDGTNTADSLIEDSTLAFHFIRGGANVTASTVYTSSFYAKASTRTRIALSTTVQIGANNESVFDLSNGTIVSTGANQTASITSVGDGWYRVSVTETASSTALRRFEIRLADATGATNYQGNGTSRAFIWGAQFETGSTATAYQRLTDQWNVTEAGKASVSYLAFDGTDDFLVSPTITPGIDKAQVFAGVRKLSDAVTGIVAELSSNWNANSGSVFIAAPSTTFPYGSGSRGEGIVATTQVATTNLGTSPDTSVLSATHDISGDISTIRRNGVAGTNGTGDKGAGNFLAYPLYVGRRGGTTLPFNGRIYQLIVRFGTNLSATRIARTEQLINEKTGAY